VKEALFVLDASTILALIRREPGADRVDSVVASSIVSTVNLQEVAKELLLQGISVGHGQQIVDALGLPAIDHDAEQAWAAATLVHATRSIGSGLGDRSCMALAISRGVPAMTADRAWAKLEVPGLQVIVIR
jgi:PIN domain nuclease of toxin-antitoxin system